MEKPKVIFLDAVGTLFGVQGSVGEIYSKLAQKSDVIVDPIALDAAFTEAFDASPPLAFPDTDVVAIPELEYQWWHDITQKSFAAVKTLEQFADFEVFFDSLYGHFATPNPWYVYDDVLPALRKWKDRGIPLGIISNFDSRLYSVLEGLKIENYFQSITFSSSVGAAKPSQEIFTAALAQHRCEPHQAWHIGDSLNADFEGAKAAGLVAWHLQRPDPALGKDG